MKKKSLFFLIIIFFLLSSNFIFAVTQKEYERLEVVYPKIKTGPQEEAVTLTKQSDFWDFVKYIFTWLIILGAIAALIGIIFGGFKYLTSADSPEKTKEAYKQIASAFIGLTILLCSYLILTAINPRLTFLKFKPLPLTEDYVELVDGDISHQLRITNASISKTFGTNFNPRKANIKGNLRVRFFENEYYKGKISEYAPTTTAASLDFDFPIKSIEIKYNGNGVYIYKDRIDRTDILNKEIFLASSCPDLKSSFNGDLINYRFLEINNFGGISDYLAIIFEQPDFLGRCRVFFEKRNNIGNVEKQERAPITRTAAKEASKELKIPYNSFSDSYGALLNKSSSASVFQIDRLSESCEVILYKKEDLSTKEGDYCRISGAQLVPRKISDFCGWWSGNFYALKIIGNCAVVGWSKERLQDVLKAHCAIFFEDVSDLRKTDLGEFTFGFPTFIKKIATIDTIAVYPLKFK